jgi:hypothetical protein
MPTRSGGSEQPSVGVQRAARFGQDGRHLEHCRPRVPKNRTPNFLSMRSGAKMKVTDVRRSGMTAVLGAALLMAGAATAHAQQSAREWAERCGRAGSGRQAVCEVRESTLRATGSFHVNARPNGSITVHSWDRPDVLVQARVQATAPNTNAARDIASRIEVRTGPGSASSTGPRTGRNEGWSVSFDVFVPQGTNLTLESVNGGIRAARISGDVQATTTNGAIDLTGIGGTVRGSSTNGGIAVQLTGRRAAEGGIDLRTTNGNVRLTLPEGYPGNLEARTVNGGIQSQIPLTVEGRIGRNVSAQIGGGGPPIRLRTTNGGISIRRG